MEQDQRAIHKLIILSILSQVSGLTSNQLMTLTLETLYMDYFAFITAYEELVRDHVIHVSIRKDEMQTDAAGQPVSRCDITPNGRAILSTLEPRIPMPIRSYLASALNGWRKDQMRENTVMATAAPDADGFYQVRLRQNDGRKETIDLRLNVPNQAIADAICANWRQFPQTLYLGILSLLTEPHAPNATGFQTGSSDSGHEKRQEPWPAEGSESSGDDGSSAFADRQLNLPVD